MIRLAVVLLAAGLAGCAALPAAGPAAEATPSGITIDAPAPLQALLARHLDLARLPALAGGEPIDDSEWNRLVEATPAQARDLLRTEGFFAPGITIDRDPAARRARLVVDPGPRAAIDRLTFEFEGALERAASADDAVAKALIEGQRRAFALQPGGMFRNPDWADAKAAAIARLRAAGYATATWAGTAAEVDPARHRVRLFLVADSGPLFRAGELAIEGLVEHDEAMVRHLAPFERGAPLAESQLLDFQERLQKAGLFDSVSVTFDPDPAQADAARVQVRLREAALQVWTLGVGISANTGPRASVEHLHRRAFGFGATARNKLEVGGLRQAWDGEISTHPGEGLYRNLLGGAIERLESDTDIVLSQRVRLGRTQDTERIERLYFVEAERSSRRVGTLRSDVSAISANYHGVWRDLDNVILPTEGASLALQGGVGRATGNITESGAFTRAWGRLTGYLPIGQSWYGQARVELGKVFGRDDVAVPESQLFRAGGDDSVRGYSYRSLGPVVDGTVASGRVVATGSVELARPVSRDLPSVWGAVFIDAGRAAESFRALDPALGVGVGVRWRSPVGPLKVDWAWAEELRRWRLHFSVGIAF